MSRKKISTTVYLTAEQVEALAALQAETGVPTALRIRDGVDMVLAKCAGITPNLDRRCTAAHPGAGRCKGVLGHKGQHRAPWGSNGTVTWEATT